MKMGISVALLLLSPLAAFAQAPVEERMVRQTRQTALQQKAEYARDQNEKAADQVKQAEEELAAARRLQQEAEKRLAEAKQRVDLAQKTLAEAQNAHKVTQERAAKTAADVRP